MKEKKREPIFCQSYYDDNNVLQDCTCGKCEEKTDIKAEAEKALIERLSNSRALEWAEASELMGKFIDKAISQAAEAEVRLFMQEMQKRADKTPPNLLLNEIVNYAGERIKALTNKIKKL